MNGASIIKDAKVIEGQLVIGNKRYTIANNPEDLFQTESVIEKNIKRPCR